MLEQTIQSKSQKPPHAERRACVRYACNAPASFQPLQARKHGTWHTATVRDISAKGMGLVLDDSVQRGTILTVVLEGAAQARPLLVRVVRAEKRPGGGWDVGCTFAIQLGDDELQALLHPGVGLPAAAEKESQALPPSGVGLPAAAEEKPQALPREASDSPTGAHDPFLQGSLNERRRFPRRRIAVRVKLSSTSARDMTPREALAIDASSGGLRLQTTCPFGRGTLLRVRSTNAPAKVPSVEVIVKSCKAHQKKWVIGTQFVQRPPSDVMLYFS